MNISQYHRERIGRYIASGRRLSAHDLSSEMLTNVILRMVDEAQAQATPNSSIEMRDHSEGKLAFVVTSEDGTVQHWVVDAKGTEGQPRPFVPGTYWNPEKPTEIYTMRSNKWSHNLKGSVYAWEIPDGLQLLGAFE